MLDRKLFDPMVPLVDLEGGLSERALAFHDHIHPASALSMEVVTYKGLLNLAHEEGLKRIETKLLQIPSPENGQTVIVQAEVETRRGTFQAVGDAIDLEELLRIFEADWEALKAGGVPLLVDEESEGDLMAQGKALLQIYFENQSPNPVVQAEVPFRMDLVHPETGEVLAVPMEGRIDQVEEEPTSGKRTLVEIKTAARRYSEGDLARHLQPTLYQWAFEAETGQRPDLRIDVLVKTKKPYLLRHLVERGPEDRLRFFTLAQAVLDGIEKEVFPPNPGWGCVGCEVAHACPWGGRGAVALPR